MNLNLSLTLLDVKLVPSVLRLIGDPGDKETQHEDTSSFYGFRFVLTLHPHSNEIKGGRNRICHCKGLEFSFLYIFFLCSYMF